MRVKTYYTFINMKILSILFLFTILIACSENQQTKEYIPHPKAKQLFDSASRLPMHSEEKAIVLFDQATQIDSNYYVAYFYKLSFQLSLNRLNDALVTAKNLIRLKPQDREVYMSAGFLYWRTGDSVSAIDHFTKASVFFDKILDTMSKSNRSYETILSNKGVNLILIGKQEQGNKILRELYNNGTDKDLKKEYVQFLNKSRKEIIEELFSQDTLTSSADPIIKE